MRTDLNRQPTIGENDADLMWRDASFEGFDGATRYQFRRPGGEWTDFIEREPLIVDYRGREPLVDGPATILDVLRETWSRMAWGDVVAVVIIAVLGVASCLAFGVVVGAAWRG